MNLRFVMGAAVVAAATAFSASAIATPQYNGNTFGTELTQTGSKAAGYYLWNDENDTRNWSIRWIGTGADESKPTWFGSIVFKNATLGTTSEFSFEGNDSSSVGFANGGFSDELSWSAITNNSGDVDGIDFTLESDTELMELTLGSSLFAGLDKVTNDPGVAGTGIFIGSNFETPDVLVFKNNNNGKVAQNFEIQVVEPSTLGLAGLALAGLALARRKRA